MVGNPSINQVMPGLHLVYWQFSTKPRYSCPKAYLYLLYVSVVLRQCELADCSVALALYAIPGTHPTQVQRFVYWQSTIKLTFICTGGEEEKEKAGFVLQTSTKADPLWTHRPWCKPRTTTCLCQANSMHLDRSYKMAYSCSSHSTHIDRSYIPACSHTEYIRVRPQTCQGTASPPACPSSPWWCPNPFCAPSPHSWPLSQPCNKRQLNDQMHGAVVFEGQSEGPLGTDHITLGLCHSLVTRSRFMITSLLPSVTAL